MKGAVRKMKLMKFSKKWMIPLIFGFCFLVAACTMPATESEPDKAGDTKTEQTAEIDKEDAEDQKEETEDKKENTVVSETTDDKEPVNPTPAALSDITAYTNVPYIALNDNVPDFTDEQKKINKSFENYSDLDEKGRCGVVIACLGRDTMPADGEERGSISSIKPTGWVQAKYDNISGKYLYNRSHLIGWQLSAENANKRNLITGTKYLNIEGMLPFENMVADYIDETDNHVMYRVTPVFDGNNLLCSGVQIEAWSVEDNGGGICFNVYCYNVQPGIAIDYATGESSLLETQETQQPSANTDEQETMVWVPTKSQSLSVNR